VQHAIKKKAGVVDQHVQWSVLVRRHREHLLREAALHDAARNRDGAAAGGRDGVGRLVRARLVQVVDHDARTVACQQSRRCRADAAAGPSHDGDLSR